MQKEVSFIVSSDPINGAQNISADGSQFDVYFPTPLIIPQKAENLQVTVESGDIWWAVPNIIENVNDTIYISYDDGGGAVDYNVTVAQGLYDLTGLNSAIQRELENIGAPISPFPLISLSADNSTQKVFITRFYTQSVIDFTQADTFRDILGFDSQIIASNPTAPLNTLADNVANFNTVNFFLVHSDIVSKGLRLNGNFNQIIAKILINVAPGSQITYTPNNPTKIEASNLKGTSRNNFRFWLTDDQNRAINTNGEYWSMTLTVKYTVIE